MQDRNFALLRLRNSLHVDELGIVHIWRQTQHANAEKVRIFAAVLALLLDEFLVAEFAGPRVDRTNNPAIALYSERGTMESAPRAGRVAELKEHRLAVRQTTLCYFVDLVWDGWGFVENIETMLT